MNAKELAIVGAVCCFLDAEMTFSMFLIFGTAAFHTERNLMIRALIPDFGVASPFLYLPLEMALVVPISLIGYIWIPRFFRGYPNLQSFFSSLCIFPFLAPLIGAFSWIPWIMVNHP